MVTRIALLQKFGGRLSGSLRSFPSFNVTSVKPSLKDSGCGTNFCEKVSISRVRGYCGGARTLCDGYALDVDRLSWSRRAMGMSAMPVSARAYSTERHTHHDMRTSGTHHKLSRCELQYRVEEPSQMRTKSGSRRRNSLVLIPTSKSLVE